MGRGIGQLVKGIIIGVVLILAIIGTMSILNDKPDSSELANQPNAVDVAAPTISVTSPDTPSQAPAANDSNDKISLSDPNATANNDSDSTTTSETSENEKTEPEKNSPIEFGKIRLTSIDYETKNTLKASYQVFDKDENIVAETSDTNETSFRLPTGEYKVISTLSPPEGTTRKIEAIHSTEFISVRADIVTQKVFKLEPPTIIGVLQVSAQNAKTNEVMRADYIVQKENGETVADRKSVTNTLFQLNAGSYKVTVRSGENTDFRTVVIEAGESTKEVFMLQEARLQGRVLVRIFDTFSSNPVLADIIISTTAGKTIQELKAVSKTELSLPQGNYKILVKGPYGQSNKTIRVIAGQAISEVFRFDAPNDTDKKESQQITDDVKISPIENDQSDPSTNPSDETTETVSGETTNDTTELPSNDSLQTGTLNLFARSNNNRTPIKSNFYVQTLSGHHLGRKIYSDSAVFNLKPGTYKITVRAKGKKNLVKNIRISAGQETNQTFSLLGVNQRTNTVPSRNNNVVSSGFLQVAIVPPRKARFIIRAQSGKQIAEVDGVPNGNFKLDSGNYKVTAIIDGKLRSKTIRIDSKRTSRVTFKSSDFQAQKQQSNTSKKGILRSRIVDQSGREIKGNLVVTNSQGRIVARANNVAVGVFRLPPASHIVSVNYRGLQGSERVKIITGETTVQTFTIAR